MHSLTCISCTYMSYVMYATCSIFISLTLLLQAMYDYVDEKNYIMPESHEEELCVQLENRKVKKIPRHHIE